MRELYEAELDPYCYPGSEVLINKAGLKDAVALQEFETAMTHARAEEPLPRGRLSVAHYRAIHRHLFQDIYDWAGDFRTVRISKEKTVFCYPENISAEAERLFSELQKNNFLAGRERRGFVAGAAHFLAELNAIHLFREGNGRAQLTFLALLADRAGYPLKLTDLDSAKTLDAMIQSYEGNENLLVTLIDSLIRVRRPTR